MKGDSQGVSTRRRLEGPVEIQAFGLELKSSVGVKSTFSAFHLTRTVSTRTVPTQNAFIKQSLRELYHRRVGFIRSLTWEVDDIEIILNTPWNIPSTN